MDFTRVKEIKVLGKSATALDIDGVRVWTRVEPSEYAVTSSLNKCTNSNSATTVANGASYSAEISCTNEYYMGEVRVTMGGVDITSSVVSKTGSRKYTINIPAVTGNIVITATVD